MNIIFLDIDGVLNSRNYLNQIHETKKILIKLDKPLYKLIEINPLKIDIVKSICVRTNSKVVITSSWRKLTEWSLIEEYLINKGIPIIDTTEDLNDRNKEITKYINEHKIKNYAIIDDEMYNYSSELLNRLIKTCFYEDGITYEQLDETINILRRRK